MVNLRRPDDCAPGSHDDPQSLWVEPRTLRPFRYGFILRETKPRALSTERTRPKFFEPTQRGVLCAGHYVYGDRHYTVAVDIKRALDGVIGDEIIPWIADVCLGERSFEVDWETPRGRQLSKGVSAVLMPLHSQIHYLWPRVEIVLAQRGRRQPRWLLDATLFLGHGPAYRLPLQFDREIRSKTRALAEAKMRRGSPNPERIRILIIDDAMVSARTAETILAEIERAVDKARDEVRKEFGEAVDEIDPIEWIRYFAIFNQMGHARHQHWHNLRRVGFGRGTPFVFEGYRWISGLPFFDELNCPHCANLARLGRTSAAAEGINGEASKVWAIERKSAIRPVALDTPGFQHSEPILLPRAIDVLGRALPGGLDKFHLLNVDEAILRFYELIYLSFPPTDALRALQAPNAWAILGEPIEIVTEYERFRWAILEWCILNWPRLVADSARSAFVALVEAEISAETKLVECLFDGLIHHRNDESIRSFIASAVRKLAALEVAQRNQSAEEERSSSRKLLLIENGLTLFMLGMTREEMAAPSWITETPNGSLLHLLSTASPLDASDLSFVRNLHLRFSRPRRFADPAWALEAVAETVFRGRDPDDATGGSHRLLPKLLYEILEDGDRPRTRRLLQSSLSLFLAALADLAPFAAESALPIEEVSKAGRAVLDWLLSKSSIPTIAEELLTSLIDLLARRAEFCSRFDEFFHATVDDMRAPLDAQRDDVLKKNSDFMFAYHVADGVERARVLTPFHRLVNFLTNWAIDRATRRIEPFQSRIEVHRQRKAIGTDRLRFRILTGFESLTVTDDWTMHGRNHDVEFRMLRLFGANLPDQWIEPSAEEKEEGFTSCYEFDMPVGFNPPNPP